MSDAEVRASSSKFDINIREEASYVLWHIWRAIHPRYSTLQACISALTSDAKLYKALKSAHGCGKYDVVRYWGALPGPSVPKIASLDSETDKFLEEIRPTMTKLVIGDISLPLWSPNPGSMDSEMAKHMEALRIPSTTKGKPNVLLHDLASFKDDPALSRRLKNIFMPNNHTFLVNTSGSGKTRLLFEGLCGYWGFYFTSLVDSSHLGSVDVQKSIRTYVLDSPGFRPVLPPPDSPEYESSLKANRDNAARIFSHIFLARLLIFDIFVEIMTEVIKENEPQDVYKQRWLLLQLQPSIIHPHIWDIFDHLVGKLSHASDSYINTTTKALLVRVRELFSVDASGDEESTAIQTPLFCVLDEAQYAATQHCGAFRSDHSNVHRPILREIVRTWEGQSFGQGVFMVVAGTGISKDVVDRAMASAIMKESKYRWCSDTGAFDDIQSQRRYILKYLPTSLIESPSGRRLLERIGYWLRGRHRFTAGYVAELLDNGFHKPHTLLNAYIEYFTHFNPTDARIFVEAEGSGSIPISLRYKLDFSKFDADMIATIYQITTHYLMRSVLPGSLGKDETIYVEYGFARFVDAETRTVAVDEPLVLLAATRWINANYLSSYKYFAKQIQFHDSWSNGFENYVGFCLSLAFSQKLRMSEVFSFCGLPPAWAKQEAELVALHLTELGEVEEGNVRHSKFFGPSVTLGTNSKTTQETSAWLRHSSHAPLCFPHVSMGPDLLFVVKLADGSFIWVALQAKYSLGKNGSLSRLFLRHAMRSVTPSKFFVEKDGRRFSPATDPDIAENTINSLEALPNRRSDAGKYSLLRVIASFPAQTNLKRCLEEDPDDEGHPIAYLNMNFIKHLTKDLSPVDFLKGLEKPQRPTGKRKPNTNEGHRRTKKLKLN
ncbi:hypothetical protein L208DRAFT_1424348 [Tricholoma matsutake]|nr:hypothetical protein L208DRAFT_1424348 [Tricholoma matsutake 945]